MGERLLDVQNAAEIRSMLEANLTHECDIQVNGTPNPNAGGGVVPTWVPQALPLTPCQCTAEAQGTVAPHNDQDRSIGTWRVRFAAGTVLTIANRLIVTGDAFGQPFTKRLVPLAISQTETSTIAHCRDATPAESK